MITCTVICNIGIRYA